MTAPTAFSPGSPVWRVPPDQGARRRIAEDLETTLFVEAGAGSGKTTALVDRLVALVAGGSAELAHIAAITFTEKAGAELRDRLRGALERSASPESAVIGPGGAGPALLAERCRRALDQLDGAAIGTLHAFAQRLLSENPVEAGLPPRVEVLDEVSSGVEFERRWTAFRDGLLAEADLERTLVLFLASGVRFEALRSLAVAFDRNWDLVAEQVPATAPDPPLVRPLLERARADITAVCAERTGCKKPEDKLALRLGDIERYVERLAALEDEADILEALGDNAPTKPPSFRVGNVGAKGNWPDHGLADLRSRVLAVGESLAAVRHTVTAACAHRLAAEVRGFTLRAADERRAAGRLEFHDLLVLARHLVRHPEQGAALRRHLHERYQRLLLDEFQDTDPIQIELAVRIAAAHPESEEAGRAPWAAVDVEPGALFVVGDPKQSIYRFRRADIATFLAARARFGPAGGGVVELTANFRTGAPVIEWVNHTVGALMSEAPALELPVPSQPEYVALQAVRPGAPEGPPVAVIGRSAHPAKSSADHLRGIEATEVAATIALALRDSWSVGDGEGWRPVRLGDITILVPARTSLPFLEDALDEAGIPFRAESSSLVYATRAVRDLLMVLRAADDPTDQLRTVAALRTPLLGCGDDDLFRWKVEYRGSWSWFAPPPEGVGPDDPVRLGLEYLRELHEQRRWLAPSALADKVVRDRRALELGFAEGRPRDVWRRLRFVIDQARAWSEATGGSLREYLYWVDQQTAEGARVAESVLPETDDDAVRIMTIHAAKGLEFPVTIVSGLSTVPQTRYSAAEVVFPPTGRVGYRFGRNVTTQEFAEFVPIDEQMGYDERIRLLYVACTRARDHLVVSLHRKERAKPPEDPAKRTNAELLLAGMGTLVDEVPDAVEPGDDATGIPVPPPVAPAAPAPFAAWEAELRAALEAGSRPTTVAATALTDEGGRDGDAPDPGLEKRPRDLDLPPWMKGRYGTAVGRAVHGVLQTVDLATGDGVDAVVAAQCEAEAVPDRAEDVGRLVRAALGSPSVRAAAVAPHWREVYACVPTAGGRLLEGYTDLLYRTGDGLVVVDYKTAATADAAELDRRVAGYRLQGAAYALVVGETTGEPVVQVTFLFLTPRGAVERHLDDLDAAVAEVRALVAAGQEVVVP